MAVLVTGGAGYIGSVAVVHLLTAGQTVVVLDNLSTGHCGALSEGAVFVEGDIRDKQRVARVLVDHAIDTVMHFAAQSIVSESCRDPGKYFDNNVVGAHTVLQAMAEAGVRAFILSSTAAVYGHPEAIPITEDMPTRPLNPYGLSKRMVEQMLEWYDRVHGIRYVSLRYFNAAGASGRFGEAHDPETHLIPNILMAVEGKRPSVTVFGTDYDTPDGTCIRDYVHVVDLADAHLKAMAWLTAGDASGIFNLGNATGNSVREVLEAVRRVTGQGFRIEYGERRAGDADRLVASSQRAQDVLGWCPRHGDIDAIVRDAWRWRQAHPHAYNPA
ncbi:MAG TPA: UDP-glucose 4-epimerase GalE [Candidatus Hydrogenedentes bacterium]|nr:UDP-glucose 4-epimerase GalE [Candidatus Hydrogenedentota bacterium]HPG69140.1 UDP-glucose 4-epimerase GalE [Candidatus Hydrogenedentota bacterium]